MKEIISRLLSPTPKFWRKVQKFCLALSAGSGFIATSTITLPDPIIKFAGYVFVAAGSVAAMAQFACTDTPKEKPPTD